MTYDELYHAAFDEGKRNENDTELEHLARTILENKFDGITDEVDAVVRAAELMQEMRGKDIDLTRDEFTDTTYYVTHPEYIRVLRGLIKAMKDANLCDYIMQNYMSFEKEDLARIIAEIDCAAYDTDTLPGKPDYHEIMDRATEELKERIY